ncbi:hypothetical protein D3C73_1232000 [compost metagenome]
MRERGDEARPVTNHQKQAKHQQRRQANAQQPATMALEQRPGTVEEGIRAPQRDAEEQVLVQRFVPQALLAGGGLHGIALALLGIVGAEQVVVAEKRQ